MWLFIHRKHDKFHNFIKKNYEVQCTPHMWSIINGLRSLFFVFSWIYRTTWHDISISFGHCGTHFGRFQWNCESDKCCNYVHTVTRTFFTWIFQVKSFACVSASHALWWTICRLGQLIIDGLSKKSSEARKNAKTTQKYSGTLDSKADNVRANAH